MKDAKNKAAQHAGIDYREFGLAVKDAGLPEQITEARRKSIAFTFGRFNPPTIGHEKLLDKVASMRADEYLIFVSHTRNPKKDPLEYSLKIAYMQRSFPKHKRNIIVSKARNIFEILVDLQKMYNPIGNPLKSLIMVVGSDRVKEFEGLINKYNGVKATHGYYNFQNIQVKSAGERDPDAEGVEGMSASKMRQAVKNDDFDSFQMGVPSSMSEVRVKKMFMDLKKHMGLREARDKDGNPYLEGTPSFRQFCQDFTPEEDVVDFTLERSLSDVESTTSSSGVKS
jgi:nicotinic acid mononucleotide adenylyltransferase